MQQARANRTSPWKPAVRIGAVLVLPVFIALKLSGTVDWSWWWVMAPWWILALLAILIAAVLAALFTLARWFLMARAWVRFRHVPELALADPAIVSRIEAEFPPGDDHQSPGPPD
jgi:hypothetical protein